MKSIKRGLAVFLATLLIMPTLPVSAQEPPDKTVIEADHLNPGDNAPDAGGTENNQTGSDQEDEADPPQDTSTPEASPEETDPSQPSGTPQETQPPTPEESPAGTASPEETQTPDAVTSPDASQSPDATQAPADSASPEATDVPEASATPTTAIVPDASASPSETPAATPSGNPTATPSGSPTATPSGSPTATPSATPTATPSATPSLEDMEIDEVCFNTGSHVWSVVNREAFDLGAGDAFFEEDGDFTINIPEENPFFPYEVQFTHEDEVTNEWFMNPDDTVEIAGHTFHVSASFDGTAVTQMSLNVAGETVIVWPEEKEFSDDADGTMETSLLPLTERNLNVDLSAYTPAELTMVSMGSVFAGANALTDTDKIVWSYGDRDDYAISASGDKLDLSYCTANNTSTTWQMIVGEADQLASSNIRYTVKIQVTPSANWLTATMSYRDIYGNFTVVPTLIDDYYDYNKGNRQLSIQVPGDALQRTEEYIEIPRAKLEINSSVFGSTVYDHFRVYKGNFTNPAEAVSAEDITDQICNGGGFFLDEWITMVTFDAGDNITGCLPFLVRFSWRSDSWVEFSDLFDKDDDSKTSVINNISASISPNFREDHGYCYSLMLNKGYGVNQTYYFQMNYYADNTQSLPDSSLAAYVGRYLSKEEAIADGAEDISAELFTAGGYGADYSKGVYFSIFCKNLDGDNRYQYYIKTEEWSDPARTGITFTGIRDSGGRDIPAYVLPYDGDSYAEDNYITILTGADVDLSSLSPVFVTDDDLKIYTAGSSMPEVSGVSIHDFSEGSVPYTASSGDGSYTKNYWLQVIKAVEGSWRLYINSLDDKNSDTKVENGVIYSTREMVLDGRHNYIHDIWLANMGTEAIPALSAMLESDVVQMDNYWTLNGNHELAGFSTTDKAAEKGELPNLAKIRLKARDGVEDGTSVTGTLTIKSGEKILMVLNLTGVIGDPYIVTEEIPQAVKYVPYAAIIQNSSKYSWNRGTYSLVEGALPDGMQLKSGGELYGVPKEAGEFTFTVRMTCQGSASVSTKTYTLTVIENTDANVDASTDYGYELIQRVQDIYKNSSLSAAERTLVSQGQYDEFQDVYLDGVKLDADADYSASSGSTRITIQEQTLVSGGAGTHTLGIEFRSKENGSLRRAAQNYVVSSDEQETGDSGSSGNGNNSAGESGTDDGNSGQESAGSTESGVSGGVDGNRANRIAGNHAGTEQDSSLEENRERTVVTYTVEEGDTLWKISGKFYGSGAFWQRIYEDNSSVITDPDKIYVGQMLTIYLTDREKADESGNSEQTGMRGNYYTVQQGDTLWKIALKVYGKGWRWRKIYQANAGEIPEPQTIFEGQILFIPE